jgi:ATP-dependent Clp protease protease subunit
MDIPMLGIVGEDITVESFRNNLQAAKGKDITLLIDSPGGDVFAGMAISNLIKDYSGNVEARILGLAGSIMTVITSSADVVNISETASFMIHNALVPMTGGNAEELRETANTLEVISNTINSVYQARTGLKQEDLQALMDQETIMNAQEAVQLGFADNIVNELKAVALINTKNMSKLSRT